MLKHCVFSSNHFFVCLANLVPSIIFSRATSTITGKKSTECLLFPMTIFLYILPCHLTKLSPIFAECRQALLLIITDVLLFFRKCGVFLIVMLGGPD